MSQLHTESRPFALRALRALAWLLFFLGSIGVVSIVVEQLNYGAASQLIRYPYSLGGSGFYVFYMMGLLIGYGSFILQVVGSIGLLFWKNWSRLVLIIWSAFRSCSLFLSMLATIFSYTRNVSSATSRPVVTNLAYVTWSMFGGWLYNCALPILTFWLLRQREVVEFWSRPRGGGFDVIPMAQVATSDQIGNPSNPNSSY
ncbi:MAG TPA: hypothetical protein VHD56_07440 [Tepidisphaeraceae bacterium]|nr:hypothetical protein [Tepidisphaeraceae bacterium]